MNKGLLILISAPSGAGKTSLVNEIINRDDQLIKSVSHTTRAKRPGEEESTDYFFTTEKEFKQMVSKMILSSMQRYSETSMGPLKIM